MFQGDELSLLSRVALIPPPPPLLENLECQFSSPQLLEAAKGIILQAVEILVDDEARRAAHAEATREFQSQLLGIYMALSDLKENKGVDLGQSLGQQTLEEEGNSNQEERKSEGPLREEERKEERETNGEEEKPMETDDSLRSERETEREREREREREKMSAERKEIPCARRLAKERGLLKTKLLLSMLPAKAPPKKKRKNSQMKLHKERGNLVALA